MYRDVSPPIALPTPGKRRWQADDIIWTADVASQSHFSGRLIETTTPVGSTSPTPAGDTVRRITWSVSGSLDSTAVGPPRSSGCSKVSGAHHAHSLRPLN